MRGLPVTLVLLGGAGGAQVPVGHLVRATFDELGASGSFGIEYVDPASGLGTPVTGLTGEAADPKRVLLDPARGDLWILTSGTGSLYRVTLAGSVGSQQWVQSGFLGASDIALDRSGNVFVSGADLWRVDRGTGAVTLWDDLTSLQGGLSGLEADPESDRLWGTVSDIQGSSVVVFDLAQGPAPPVLLADVAGSFLFEGLTFDGGSKLYACHLIGEGMFRVDVETGSSEPLAAMSLIAHRNARFHRGTGLVYGVSLPYLGAYDPAADAFAILDTPTYLDGQSGLDANDWKDRTVAYPHRASAASGFVLEATAHGHAGELAGVALVAVNGQAIPPLVLGLGWTDAGGFLATTTTVAAGGLPPNTVLRLKSARVDGLSSSVVLGTAVEVLVGP